MPIIEIENVVKRYRLGQTHALSDSLRRLVGLDKANDPSRPRHFNALNGVDFKVEEGEVLGIIGTNGAGKSTLLKVLARITTPTSGRMIARGRVAPLIEVGAGLIGDLTGRENIYLNGVILGMSVKEIRRKMDDIIGFAELEKFIDTPIKRYSSGMAIRLGFSIATSVDADILIVDEVLAVGDMAFQRKCFDRIEEIIKHQHKTILLVSHNIRQVERLCTRTILLDHGRVIADGSARDVCRQFYERTNTKMREDAIATKNRSKGTPDETTEDWPDIEMCGIHAVDDIGNPIDVVPYLRDMTVEVHFRAHKDLRRPVFSMGVHTSDMLYLATHDSDMQLSIDSLTRGEYTIRCTFRRPPLIPGVYSLRLGISENDGTKPAYYGENLLHFQISTEDALEPPPSSPYGFLALDGHWATPESVTQPDRVRIAA